MFSLAEPPLFTRLRNAGTVLVAGALDVVEWGAPPYADVTAQTLPELDRFPERELAKFRPRSAHRPRT
ncbi:hypothetical protein FKR81_10750 [Lentzea tibetensis]|uniref:Uncharacterized protein n=1 Tax=Lentzea tibetensis TaxID=2591470 RepID=A0A563EWH6_9PSEU|nr:hypothetical protein [Lentzea tibetensis]TWP52056.1 hypothetical protein FKR81_10750 [Lentzea tibetensis]